MNKWVESAAAYQLFDPHITQVYGVDTTLERMLGPRRQADMLGLWRTPVEVRAFDTNQHTIYSTFFYDSEFYGKAFADIFAWARPKYHPSSYSAQGRIGIYNDWALLDELDEVQNQYLARIHKHLEPHWSIWNNNDRRRFLDALSAPTMEEQGSFFWMAENKVISKETALLCLRSTVINREKDSWRGTHYGNTNYFLRTHYSQLKDALRINGRRITKRSLFGDNWRRVTEDIFEDMPYQGELTQRLIGSGFLYFYDDFIVVDPRNESLGSAKKIRRVGNNIPVLVFNEEHGVVRLALGKSSISFWTGPPRIVANKVYRDPSEDALKPWSLWTVNKETGERSTPLFNLPDEFLEVVDPKASARLGLLAKAAYSREQRDTVSTRAGLPGSQKVQQLRDAQTVITVPAENYKILPSPVYSGIENHVAVNQAKAA